MSFVPIKSVSIYLWFRIILKKYGKGAKYFDRHCLKNIKQHFFKNRRCISTQFAIIYRKISILHHFNTKKSQHKSYYFDKFQFFWNWRNLLAKHMNLQSNNTKYPVDYNRSRYQDFLSLNIRSKFLNSVLFSTKSALFVFSDNTGQSIMAYCAG